MYVCIWLCATGVLLLPALLRFSSHASAHTQLHLMATTVTAYTFCLASAGEFHFIFVCTQLCFASVVFPTLFCTAIRSIFFAVAAFFPWASEFCFHGTFCGIFTQYQIFQLHTFGVVGGVGVENIEMVGRLFCGFGIWCRYAYWFLYCEVEIISVRKYFGNFFVGMG